MGIEHSGTRTTPRMDLGQAVLEFIVKRSEFIGLQALPLFEAQLKAAVFNAITRESLTKIPVTKRAPGGNYNRLNFETAEKNFSCVEHGLEGPLDDGEKKLYANDFSAELVTVEQITGLILLAQELRIATALFNTGTFTGAARYTDYSTAPWDNIATSILGQVRAAKEKVRQSTGMMPNTIIFSETNLNRIKLNTEIKDAIKYTTKLTDDELFAAFGALVGIKKVLVGKAVRNTSNKGITFSGNDIWSDDYAMVAVTADNPRNLKEPSVGRTFLWVADSPANPVVESYRDDAIRSDVFRVRHDIDEKVIDSYFGHLMKVDA